MEKLKSGSSNGLPPGFRFHPTDEELIMYYLINHATLRPCPVPIISQVDIYKFNPWELPEKAAFGEREWYFFSLRDRKYPNGTRPNRTAASGYWKATGTDKAIYSGSKYVGVKKALVFNKGRSPKGEKTDWIMHEYRLSDSITRPRRLNRSTKLDDWVLCKIYKKRHHEGIMEQKLENSGTQNPVSFALIESDQELKIPSSCSLLSLSEFDYQSISCTLSESSFGSSDVFQICNDNRNTECSNMNDFQLSSMPYQFMNIAEFRV